METMIHKYEVAGHVFCVAAAAGCESWERLKWHYDVFPAAEGSPLFTLHVEQGFVDSAVYEGMDVLYKEETQEAGMMSFTVYHDGEGNLLFAIQYPQTSGTHGWVFADKELKDFRIVVGDLHREVKNQAGAEWIMDATLTTGAMLSFMLATTKHDTLTMHSSCVKKDGKAYLFLGKSGTGKSTHARLWLKNIAETMLLNDDHPIIRINAEGKAIAYGSPWSGKTDCYVNQQAEIGAIVKIERAPYNKARRLSPIEAYSKLMVSASGLTWFAPLADSRHKTIEQVVKSTKIYELECLPDDDAAIVCHANVCK